MKLQDLRVFAGEDKKWGTLVNKKDVAIYTVDSLKMLRYLIDYLEKYPLKSIKSVAYAK